MGASDRYEYKVELANGKACNLFGVAKYINGCRNTWVLEPQKSQEKARAVADAANFIERGRVGTVEPLPCYRCGKVPTVDGNGGYPTVSCDGCYSGPSDFCASGLNTAQAVADWNERMEMEEPFTGVALSPAAFRRISRALTLIRSLRRCWTVGSEVSEARRWALRDAVSRMSRLYGGSR